MYLWLFRLCLFRYSIEIINLLKIVDKYHEKFEKIMHKHLPDFPNITENYVNQSPISRSPSATEILTITQDFEHRYRELCKKYRCEQNRVRLMQNQIKQLQVCSLVSNHPYFRLNEMT